MEHETPSWGITANAILAMIEARILRVEQEWSAGEKGTSDSRGLLDRTEELYDLKWEIIDALNEDSQAHNSPQGPPHLRAIE